MSYVFSQSAARWRSCSCTGLAGFRYSRREIRVCWKRSGLATSSRISRLCREILLPVIWTIGKGVQADTGGTPVPPLRCGPKCLGILAQTLRPASVRPASGRDALPRVRGHFGNVAAFLLFLLAQLREHTVVFQRCGIASDMTAGCDFLEQTPHNLAAPRLRQCFGKPDIVWFCDAADDLTDVLPELLPDATADK
jgi:hypothetical protein